MTLEFIIALCALGVVAVSAGATAVLKGARKANAKKAEESTGIAENGQSQNTVEKTADEKEDISKTEQSETVAKESATEEKSETADISTVLQEPIEQVIIVEKTEEKAEEGSQNLANSATEEKSAEEEEKEEPEEYLSVIKLSATPLKYLKDESAGFGETEMDKTVLEKGEINGEPIVIIGGDENLILRDGTETVSQESAAEEQPVETEEVIVIRNVNPKEDVVIETVASENVSDSVFANGSFGTRIPFKDKMLAAEESVQGYYDELNNEFLSYRKVHGRVSIAGASYRFGRDLIAKITYRGKTMKLHLALKVKDFDENLYYQKDMGEVKAYAEVPFTVKVKSERGVKRAIDLIAALAEKNGIEKKTRFEMVNSIKELKEI